jgi:hypothetical protein
MKTLAILTTLLGAALTAGNGWVMFDDTETCRRKTQYDTSTGNIVTCPENLCDPNPPKCERDDVVFTDEEGFAVTIVFCSCGPIDETDIFEDETCHIYRFHRGSVTEPKCNEEECTPPTACDIADPNLTVQTCECP